jgi:hypothetical protein
LVLSPRIMSDSAGDPAAATGNNGPTYGARHMNQRITSRKAALKPQSLEPRYPPIYPVYPRSAPANVKPNALRVHPKGFRMLSSGSPLERNMLTYFRLPPQPPRRLAAEKSALSQVIDKDLAATGAMDEGVVLNGFMMLQATGVEDPADATTVTICDSNIVGAVGEDLAYFINVTNADFGENTIPLADLAPLSNLETLHLHCNGLASLGGLTHGAFPRLHTLNLSFNQISQPQLAALSNLPVLERLDLSCNALGELPTEFRSLRNLRQLALENNRLKNAASVFRVLGQLPNLEEVNLNYNKLGTVPSIRRLEDDVRAEVTAEEDATATDAGDPDNDRIAFAGLFLKLLVLGMGANQFVYFEDVLNIAEMPALEQVVLWGNPLEARRKDCEVLTYEMAQRGITVILDPPVPGKKKQADFFAETKKEHVKVARVDGRGLPRGQKIKTTKRADAADVGEHTQQSSTAEDETGSSFFMTQTGNASGQQPQQQTAPSGANASGRSPTGGTPIAHGTSFGMSTPGGADIVPLGTGVGHRPSRLHRLHTAGSQASGVSHGTRSLPSPVTGPAPLTGGDDEYEDYTATGPSAVELRLRELAARVDTGPRPNANMRSVMSELRNMLRQPLPPLNRPRFAAAKKKRRLTHGQVGEGSDGTSGDDG